MNPLFLTIMHIVTPIFSLHIGLPTHVKSVVRGKEVELPVTGLAIPPCGLMNTVHIPMLPEVEGATKVDDQMQQLST